MRIKNLKNGFEKLTIAKARIIAHLIGDGCIYKSNHDYNIKYEVKDQDSLNSFEDDMLSVYGLRLLKGFKASGITGKPIPFIRLRSKLAYHDLLRYATTYASQNWKVGRELLSASKEIKKEFLKALFDDEGSIVPEGKSGIIKLYSINAKGLKQIQRLLHELGMKTKLTAGYGSKRNVYALLIRDLNSFYDKIGFNLKRKQDKLNQLKQ